MQIGQSIPGVRGTHLLEVISTFGISKWILTVVKFLPPFFRSILRLAGRDLEIGYASEYLA